MKRLFDIVCSFFGLVFLSWLFVFVALWVGLSSRGGVFYRQRRVGRCNRDFTIYKFRSMRVNSDRQGKKVLDEPKNVWYFQSMSNQCKDTPRLMACTVRPH